MINKILKIVIFLLILGSALSYGVFYVKNNTDAVSGIFTKFQEDIKGTIKKENLKDPFVTEEVLDKTVENLTQEVTNILENDIEAIKENNTEVTINSTTQNEETIFPENVNSATIIETITNLPVTVNKLEQDTKISMDLKTILKIGSRGPEVVKLQSFLIEEKHLLGKADGIFGKMTESAVKSFQVKYNLTADGVVGGQTKTIINELLANN